MCKLAMQRNISDDAVCSIPDAIENKNILYGAVTIA